MKKIIVIILVGAVPFFSFSQKRGKKGDNITYQYMIIKAVEVPVESEGDLNNQGEDVVVEAAMKQVVKPNVKMVVQFDYGSGNKKEASEMMRRSRSFASKASALNAAANKGWEFINASTTMVNNISTHYYFMRRAK